MWLYIESTHHDAFTVGLLGSGAPKISHIQDKSHGILKECMRRMSGKSVTGICVVAGPGSFTSTRTGVLIANLLSRMLRVPLIGVALEDATDLTELSRRLLSGMAGVSYVAPVYSAEPNITVPA